MASNPDFIKNRLSFAVNVMGYGADSSGLADSRQAFVDAIAACVGRDYATLLVPAGTYRIVIPTDGPEEGIGLLMERLSGLCIRGDGALRSDSQEDEFVGSTIVFEVDLGVTTGEQLGLVIRACPGLRIENLTIYGAPAVSYAGLRAVGVRLESITNEGGTVGTTGVQFQNAVFRWCDICVQTKFNQNNNSELAFYDCVFDQSRIGFQPGKNQSLVHKFFGCVGGEQNNTGMEIMFDLTYGGNVTVVGFGGQQIKTLVVAGIGGASMGWNKFINVRLESVGSFATNYRTKFYKATLSNEYQGHQRTTFDGLLLVAFEENNTGTTRFTLLRGHEVELRNAGRNANEAISTATSPLVEFALDGSEEEPGGTFRAYNVDVPFDARLDRDNVPALARYSFQDCQDTVKLDELYPDRSNPPLNGPNFLMVAESHCWSVAGLKDVGPVPSTGGFIDDVTPSDSARFGVIRCNRPSNGSAALMSHTAAMRKGGGGWRYQAAVRVTAVHDESTGTEFSVRMGFGDNASGEPNNGAYFRFVDQGNDNQWEGVLRWNSATPVVVDTNVTKDQDWHNFEIEVNAAGTIADFYIDGEHVGTATNSIAQSDPLGLMPLQIVRIAGETAKGAEIDYFRYQIRPSAPSPFYPE